MLHPARRGKTMNKNELIQAIAKQTDMTQRDTQKLVEAFAQTVTDTLKKGEKITITGFGTWEVSKRAARIGRNPSTGEEIKIKAKKLPKWKAGKHVKDSLNG